MSEFEQETRHERQIRDVRDRHQQYAQDFEMYICLLRSPEIIEYERLKKKFQNPRHELRVEIELAGGGQYLAETVDARHIEKIVRRMYE